MRNRVQSATVFVDANNGNDANDGATAATAYRTLQCALDHAASDFDICAPYSWSEFGNVGYRGGVTIQMAANTPSQPFLLPSPTFLDGLACSGPITLLGDPANPMSYCIMAENNLQGLTAQNGGVLICRGFRIWSSVADCTLINALDGGKITIDTVTFGGGALGSAIGAANGSNVDLIGPVTLVGGAGFISVLEAVNGSQIDFATSAATINIANNMNFGIMCVMSHGMITAEASAPAWTGTGSGQKLEAFRASYLGFNHDLIPGSYDPATDQDASSTVL